MQYMVFSKYFMGYERNAAGYLQAFHAKHCRSEPITKLVTFFILQSFSLNQSNLFYLQQVATSGK
jgi:hypothetical protein